MFQAFEKLQILDGEVGGREREKIASQWVSQCQKT
jgi:hypothetical protein